MNPRRNQARNRPGKGPGCWATPNIINNPAVKYQNYFRAKSGSPPRPIQKNRRGNRSNITHHTSNLGACGSHGFQETCSDHEGKPTETQNPNSRRAASDIISFVHGGSQTRSRSTSTTPSTDCAFLCTSAGSSSAAGQFGAVKVI